MSIVKLVKGKLRSKSMAVQVGAVSIFGRRQDHPSGSIRKEPLKDRDLRLGGCDEV